jgi:hypothetical protein
MTGFILAFIGVPILTVILWPPEMKLVITICDQAAP